jgi:hypothetical protein
MSSITGTSLPFLWTVIIIHAPLRWDNRHNPFDCNDLRKTPRTGGRRTDPNLRSYPIVVTPCHVTTCVIRTIRTPGATIPTSGIDITPSTVTTYVHRSEYPGCTVLAGCIVRKTATNRRVTIPPRYIHPPIARPPGRPKLSTGRPAARPKLSTGRPPEAVDRPPDPAARPKLSTGRPKLSTGHRIRPPDSTRPGAHTNAPTGITGRGVSIVIFVLIRGA